MTRLEERLAMLQIEPPQELLAAVLARAKTRAQKRRVPIRGFVVIAILAAALSASAVGADSYFDKPAFMPWRTANRDSDSMYTRRGPFSEETALLHAQELAAAYLEDTLANQYQIDGRPVRLSDLELVSREFIPGQPCDNPTPGFVCDGMSGRWAFRWELKHYWVAEWGKWGSIEVHVTFDDATGVTKRAGAGVGADP